MRPPAKPRIQEAPHRHPAFDYRPPVYLKAGKWAIVTVAVVTLLTALYVGLWYYTAGQLRDAALAWIEARRQEGVTVRFERLDIGGFPFHLRLAVVKPAIALPKATTPWGWEGEAVTAMVRPWDFGRLTLRAPGNHALMWTADGAPHTLHGQIDSLLATVHLAGGWPTAVQVDLVGAAFTGNAPLTRLNIGQGTLEADFRPTAEATDRTPVAEGRLTLQDLGVPADWGLPLGADIAATEINATLLGRLSPGPLAAALAQWRDDGGTVDVRRFGLTYGPLVLAADGTLALDAAMQPIGAFTARAEGFFETVDALRTHGIIRSRDAITAKLVLGALAKRSENGHTSLTVPLTIQDRRLFAGPVPLITIPPIPWQETKPGG